jgi:xylan 1,4-beta-xylosidase
MPPRASSLLALMAALLVCSPVLAESNAVTITVNGAAEGRELRPIWAYFGYDEVNATTTPEGRELLRTLALANDARVRVRTHFLFNSGDETTRFKWGATNLYSEDPSGAPVYDFSRIDAIMDAKVEAGVAALFELGFMPRALSTRPEPYETSGTYTLDSGSFYPPTDYEKWARLVSVWAEHARDRYAQGAPQADWLWELWNEPDIPYWNGTPAEYHRLYDYTEAALHSVLPSAALGGPAVARPWGPFLADFLQHCESGENAVTGARGTRLDFVTFHAKGGVTRVDGHVQLDLGQQLAFHRAGFDAVAASAFARTPVIISEADPDGCAACPSSTVRHLDYRNSPAYGAYEVAMMKRSLDLADEMQIDLRGVLTWAFTFPGTDYFAGHRALATNGIHLPVLNAFKLLGRLRGQRLPVESDGALPLEEIEPGGFRSRPDIDALASTDGSQLQILTWHYHDDLVPADPAPVTIAVQVPEWLGSRVRVRHQRVDEAHGDAFVVWQQQGSPAAPSPAQRSELLEAMAKLELEPERTVRVEHGVATLAFELPRFAVSLLTLSPALEPEPLRISAQGGCSFTFAASTPCGAVTSLLIALGLVGARRRAQRRRRRGLPCLARRARPSSEEHRGRRNQQQADERAAVAQPPRGATELFDDAGVHEAERHQRGENMPKVLVESVGGTDPERHEESEHDERRTEVHAMGRERRTPDERRRAQANRDHRQEQHAEQRRERALAAALELGAERHDPEQAGLGQSIQEQVALGRLLGRGQTAHEARDIELNEATRGVGDGRSGPPVASRANDLLAQRGRRRGVLDQRRQGGCRSQGDDRDRAQLERFAPKSGSPQAPHQKRQERCRHRIGGRLGKQRQGHHGQGPAEVALTSCFVPLGAEIDGGQHQRRRQRVVVHSDRIDDAGRPQHDQGRREPQAVPTHAAAPEDQQGYDDEAEKQQQRKPLQRKLERQPRARHELGPQRSQRVVARWVPTGAALAHAWQPPLRHRLDVLDVGRAVVVALRNGRVRQVIHTHDGAGEHDRDRAPVEAQPTEHVRFEDYRAAEHEPETHQQHGNLYRSAPSKSGPRMTKTFRQEARIAT